MFSIPHSDFCYITISDLATAQISCHAVSAGKARKRHGIEPLARKSTVPHTIKPRHDRAIKGHPQQSGTLPSRHGPIVPIDPALDAAMGARRANGTVLDRPLDSRNQML